MTRLNNRKRFRLDQAGICQWPFSIDALTILIVKTIGPPHSHYLSAAQGWMELGNLAESRAELDRMPESLQNHPQVLEVRWDICAMEKDWTAALAVAREFLKVAPESLMGWVHQAFAARRAPGGGLKVAWDALFPAMEKFPDEALVPYNLACYACQMQQLDVARIMFKRAMNLGDKGHFKKMALSDPDLEPLWDELRQL